LEADMMKVALRKSLHTWAETALRDGRETSFALRTRFRIPGAGPVDLLTVRQSADRFAVGLWSIDPGALGDAAVDAMMRRLHAFEAWYSELREHAETQGFRPAHRIRVCGNLVGRSIRTSPLVNLLSNWGCAICFWTWKRAGSGIDVEPYYGKGPALSSPRAQLKGLLHRLRWEDSVEREDERRVLDRRASR
jgi:hypothetical protein